MNEKTQEAILDRNNYATRERATLDTGISNWVIQRGINLGKIRVHPTETSRKGGPLIYIPDAKKFSNRLKKLKKEFGLKELSI